MVGLEQHSNVLSSSHHYLLHAAGVPRHEAANVVDLGSGAGRRVDTHKSLCVQLYNYIFMPYLPSDRHMCVVRLVQLAQFPPCESTHRFDLRAAVFPRARSEAASKRLVSITRHDRFKQNVWGVSNSTAVQGYCTRLAAPLTSPDHQVSCILPQTVYACLTFRRVVNAHAQQARALQYCVMIVHECIVVLTNCNIRSYSKAPHPRTHSH